MASLTTVYYRDETDSILSVEMVKYILFSALQWCHNERNGIKSLASQLFAQSFVLAQIKENIKALCHWPLWEESTSDQWIPLTKGQWHRIFFLFDDIIIEIPQHGIMDHNWNAIRTVIMQQYTSCPLWDFNSLRSSDTYMRQSANHHWFR